MRLRRLLPFAVACALLIAPLGAQGGFAPLALVWERGAAVTAANERDAAVAVGPDGTTVVVWREPLGESYAVRLSAFSLRGDPLIARQLVAETPFPSAIEVATDATGNIVVGYLSGGLQLHGLTAAGEARPGLRQTLPASAFSLAVAPEGQIALAWTEEVSDTYTLRLRQIAPTGAQGWTQTVAAGTLNFRPDVAVDGQGNAVVVYSYLADEGVVRHAIRRYDAAGGLSWGDDNLDRTTARHFFDPQVAADEDGNSVVVWNGEVRTGSYPDETIEYGARFRRYRPDGSSPDQGQSLRLRPAGETGNSFGPLVAAVDTGLFAVGWRGDANELRFARLRFADGAREPSRFVAAYSPAHAIDGRDGLIALAWDNEEDSGLETLSAEAAPAQASTGVYARLYAPYNSYSLATSTAGTHEGAGAPVIFTVSRGDVAGPSNVGYRLEGTARFGLDYTLVAPPPGVVTETGRLRFPAGASDLRLTLAIVDDAMGEPLKTIVLRLDSPTGLDELSFPVAVVTLGDNDLAEVRIAQTGGGTVVRRGAPPDRLAVALRSVPAHRVVVTLTPSDRRINLGMGYGAPLRLVFEPDASAKNQQWVSVFTVDADAALAANAGIALAASSADPGYDKGARFTVDGRDLGTIPVEIVTAPGENPNPALPSVFLPLVQR